MTPWRDCAPCHSQPDGARLPLTRHPAYGTSPPTRANSVREGHSLPTACRIPPAMAARPPSSCRCGCLAPPSSPSIGIWLGPFAFPYPSSMVSTTRTSRFGGFGVNRRRGHRPTLRPGQRPPTNFYEDWYGAGRVLKPAVDFPVARAQRSSSPVRWILAKNSGENGRLRTSVSCAIRPIIAQLWPAAITPTSRRRRSIP